MKISLAHLYPDLLNMSADKGNIYAISQRAHKRNIEFESKEYKINEDIDFENTHILLIGGGMDKDKLTVSKRLLEQKEKIDKFVSDGGIVFAVASSFPIIGKDFEVEGEKYEGLNLVDMHTVFERKRKTGNVILKSDVLNCMIAGFENHNDKTIFGEGVINLGNVVFGSDKGENEGVIADNVIGTHLHGPILPKNPELTDYIIKKALEKDGITKEIDEIDSVYEHKAKNYIINKLLK